MKRLRDGSDGSGQGPEPTPARSAGKATLTQRMPAKVASTEASPTSAGTQRDEARTPHDALAFLDVPLGRSLVTGASTSAASPAVQRKASPSWLPGEDPFAVHLLDKDCAAQVGAQQATRATEDGVEPRGRPIQRKATLAGEARALTSMDDGIDTNYYEARATVDPAAAADAAAAPGAPKRRPAAPPKHAQREPRAAISMDDGVGGDFYDERATVDATLTIDLPPDKLARAQRKNPRWLHKLGVAGSMISDAAPDSEDFALAVAEVQQAYGLEVDGVIGPKTAKALGIHRGADGADDAAGADDESHDAGPAPVQRKADGVPTEDSVHAAAAQGVAGGGSALPHLERIQQAFGAHDVSEIQAHVGGDAASAAKTIGAEAYATGNDVAFAGAPDLHTAAHEAAHVVQQRGGVQLKGGVGEVGDPYEQHADAVADAVVRGESAEPLLGATPGAARAQGGVQKRAATADALSGQAGELIHVSDSARELLEAVNHIRTAKVTAENILGQVRGGLSTNSATPILARVIMDLAPHVTQVVSKRTENAKSGHADGALDLALVKNMPRVEDALNNVARVAYEVAGGGPNTRPASPEYLIVDGPLAMLQATAASFWTLPADGDEAQTRRFDAEACPEGGREENPEHCNLSDSKRVELRGNVSSGIAQAIDSFERACTPFKDTLAAAIKKDADSAKLWNGILVDGVTQIVSQYAPGGAATKFALSVARKFVEAHATPSQDPRKDSVAMLGALTKALRSRLAAINEDILQLDDAGLMMVQTALEMLTVDLFTERLKKLTDRYREQIEPIGHVAQLGEAPGDYALSDYRSAWLTTPDGRRRLALVGHRGEPVGDAFSHARGGPPEVDRYQFVRWIDSNMTELAAAESAPDVPLSEVSGAPWLTMVSGGGAHP